MTPQDEPRQRESDSVSDRQATASTRSRRHWIERARVLLILPLLLTLGACSGALPGQQDPELATEIRNLQRRVVELEKQSRVDQVEQARLRLRIAELEAARGGSAARRAQAQTPPPRVDEVDREMRRQEAERRARTYEGSVEEEDLEAVSYGTSRDTATTRTSREPADRQPANRELGREPATREPATRETRDSSPSTPAPIAGSTTGSAQELYDRGYTLYHQSQFVDAESTFQQYLQRHPSSDLADNAQYWIGESRYARKDYQGALAAFVETVDRYPQGNKVPAALLKAGQCLEQLGDLETARQTYRQLIERFPNSASTVTAQERLNQLR